MEAHCCIDLLLVHEEPELLAFQTLNVLYHFHDKTAAILR